MSDISSLHWRLLAIADHGDLSNYISIPIRVGHVSEQAAEPLLNKLYVDRRASQRREVIGRVNRCCGLDLCRHYLQEYPHGFTSGGQVDKGKLP